MANRVTTVFDLDAKSFTSTLKGIGTSFRDADGVVGKFKAGSKAAFDGLKQYSVEAAMAAGAALVAFGIKAVGAFQETALAAGKFSEAAGWAVDDASRWSEVAADLGIPVATLEGAVLKFNKAVADGKPSIAEYGVEVVKTKDGVIDANASFQNAITTIGGIEDPTKRAKAAQELFGRSYGEVAELMEMSADDLTKALAGVSDSKVITNEELAKARKMRELIDRVKDVWEDFVLAVGGAVVELVPAMENLAETAGGIADAIGTVNEAADKLTGGGLLGWLGKLWDAFITLDNAREGWRRATDEDAGVLERLYGGVELLIGGIPILGEGIGWLGDKIWGTAGKGDELGTALAEMAVEALAAGRAAQSAGVGGVRTFSDSATTAAEELHAAQVATTAFDLALRDLLGRLDEQDAFANFQEKMWAYRSDLDLSDQETRDYTRSLGEMVAGLEGVPAETKASLIASLEAGDIATVEAYLVEWGKGVNVPVKFYPQGTIPIKGAYAHGTEHAAPGVALVGEDGPELVWMNGGEKVSNASTTSQMLNGGSGGASSSGGQGTTNFYISTGADPRQVIEIIRRAQRTGQL